MITDEIKIQVTILYFVFIADIFEATKQYIKHFTTTELMLNTNYNRGNLQIHNDTIATNTFIPSYQLVNLLTKAFLHFHFSTISLSARFSGLLKLNTVFCNVNALLLSVLAYK